MKTWYKDINWLDVCLWDKFEFKNKKYTWVGIVSFNWVDILNASFC